MYTMRFLVVVVLLVLMTYVDFNYAESIDECLKKDSISCVQKTLFRKAKAFFDNESFEIVTGISLVKPSDKRTGKEFIYERDIDNADNVVDRQSVLERFLGNRIYDFITSRSLKINFSPVFDKIGESARAIGDSMPAEVRKAADEVVEGRGKKKLLKSILPLLIAAKLKIGALATLAYFGIALLAKKAILAAVVSIAISAFLGLKALWASKSNVHDTTGYNSGWNGGSSSSGWSAPTGWEDGHGSYSAQSQAYSGYHR